VNFVDGGSASRASSRRGWTRWQDEAMADNGVCVKALLHLQEELVKMQQCVRDEYQRVVIVIEGRDAAGKGGVIKRITE